MDEPVEDSEPVSGQWNPVLVTALLLLVGPLIPVVLVAIVIALTLAHSYVVSNVRPAWSASTRITELETDLTLQFYLVWDVSNDPGRYLYVDAPAGRIRIHMMAFDWAHNSRTSVYLTPNRTIAVLGPIGDDHLISPDAPGAIRLPGVDEADSAGIASRNWTYLGAFDYVLNVNGPKSFRFVDATEQAECIPMLSNGPYKEYAVRAKARRTNCQHLVDSDPGKR